MSSEVDWIAYRVIRPQVRLRLFCFPYAGGGASVFRTWGHSLPATVEVCPVQLPGKEVRWSERAHRRIEPLVEALCEALKPLLVQPYALFGHSMGALIAFEFARALHRSYGAGPCHMFVAARGSPRREDPNSGMHLLPDDELVRRLASFNGTPEEIFRNAEVLDYYLPVIRADLAMCGNYAYVPGEPLNCPLTIYGGHQDAETSYQELLAWRTETSSTCRVKLFEGGHFFIHDSRTSLLRALSEELSRYVLPRIH